MKRTPEQIREYNKIRARKYRKDNNEKHNCYRRKHYSENKDDINKRKKEWRKKNREKENTQKRKYRSSHPWSVTLENINSRVNGYGGRTDYLHIQNCLSLKQLKYLWYRDKADNMARPRLHRKNNNKDYTIRNCKYVEQSWHSAHHNSNRNKSRKDLDVQGSVIT